MSEKDSTVAKRPEDMTAYERWELPNLNTDEAVNLRPPSAAELEKIREQAYLEGLRQGRDEGLKKGKDEGFEIGRKEGVQQGLSEGLKQAESKLEATKKSLESIIKQLLTPVEIEQEKLEQVMMNVVLALTRSVIHSEIHTRTDIIERALHKAIQSLPKHSESLTIKLNPDDIEAVQGIVSGLSPDTSVLSDKSVVRGGCAIESTDQLIDFTIEKRFQKAVQAMLMSASSASDGEVMSESPQELQSHTDFSKDILDEGVPPQNEEGSDDDQPA